MSNTEKLSQKGDCFKVAYEIILCNPNKFDFIGEPFLVHAVVNGGGKLTGIKHTHAWVEDDIFAYDYANGREFIVPKGEYYRIGGMRWTDSTQYRKYDKQEAMKRVDETGKYFFGDVEALPSNIN